MDSYRLFGDNQCLAAIDEHRQTLEEMRKMLSIDERGRNEAGAQSQSINSFFRYPVVILTTHRAIDASEYARQNYPP